MKLNTFALLLLSFLFCSCASESPVAPTEAKRELVTVQIFGKNHRNNPWSWSASAVVFHDDTLTTYLKQSYSTAGITLEA